MPLPKERELSVPLPKERELSVPLPKQRELSVPLPKQRQLSVPQPKLRSASVPHPERQLPARIGDDLILGGMDVMEVFQSGEGGDEGLEHIEAVVRREAGAEAWEDNREQITALFADDSIRPKVPGMLRGGRTISHVVDLGAGGILAIELRLDGASEALPTALQG